MTLNHSEQVTDTGTVLLPAREVLRRVPVHEATLWRWIAAGQFPPPDKILNGKRYWLDSTIDAFQKEGA